MIRAIAFPVKAALFLCVSAGGLGASAFAQANSSAEHHAHESSDWELGFSVGYAYLKAEREEGQSLHLHVMKRLSGPGITQYLSVGLGAETIMADDRHYGLMVPLAVHPWRGLILSVAPGMEWATHDGKRESEYATHWEAAYVFEGPGFHVGPVIGGSKTRDEQHYTAGLHIAWPL